MTARWLRDDGADDGAEAHRRSIPLGRLLERARTALARSATSQTNNAASRFCPQSRQLRSAIQNGLRVTRAARRSTCTRRLALVAHRLARAPRRRGRASGPSLPRLRNDFTRPLHRAADSPRVATERELAGGGDLIFSETGLADCVERGLVSRSERPHPDVNYRTNQRWRRRRYQALSRRESSSRGLEAVAARRCVRHFTPALTASHRPR